MRVTKHPILPDVDQPDITITVDGREIPAKSGEPIAAALLASGVRVFRKTAKKGYPRGIFCGIGRCRLRHDCGRQAQRADLRHSRSGRHESGNPKWFRKVG